MHVEVEHHYDFTINAMRCHIYFQRSIMGNFLLYYLLPQAVNVCLTLLILTLLFTANSVNAQTKGFLSAPSKSLYNYNESINHHMFPGINEFSTHTVIKPHMHHALNKRQIYSTLDANGLHLPNVVLSYHHRGERTFVDLKRNDLLLPDVHFLRYQNSNNSQHAIASNVIVVKNFTKAELKLCHYQGSIRNRPQSYVAVSTCSDDGNGINGIVFDGNDTYYIYSTKSGQLCDDHLLLHAENLLNGNFSCGIDDDSDERGDDTLNIDNHNFKMNVPKLRFKRLATTADNSQVIRGPFNSNKHSSYVELVMVVDNKAYKSFGENMKKVHQHCKDLANIINALYVPLNIFIALVGVVIWNESNEIEITPDADVTLRNFLIYRRTKLVLEHPNDNAQLLTKVKFEKGVVGKALKGPICTHEFSGSVSMEHSQIVAVVATTMAHELGHNFGMEHDSPDCKCQDEKCIMSASSTSVVPVHWSSCSVDQLNIAFSRGMNYCLRNKPIKLFDSPQCGNGFVEPGEQCDCGLPAYCENTCCDPHTCMLHSNASCATGECCDLTTCRPKVASTLCRVAENECDLPEYCTGESEYCPTDVFKRDTEECDSGRAYCYQGSCRSHSHQCRILWGPTGENSEPCYIQMNTQGKRGGNCGVNRLNNTFIPCNVEHVACGMLHCRHLNERLEFGMESAAVLSHSFINHDNNIVPCRTALVDLGLQSTDPGLAPNGAKCGDQKMCINQKCVPVDYLRTTGMGKPCPENCNSNGVCNSRGNCHCNIGFTGLTCMMPGHGGSVDSGPATNPNSHEAFQRFIYIFLFAVIPIMAAFCFIMYYCRNHPLFLGGKLAENIMKSASGGPKQTSGDTNNITNNGLPKSTSMPSSTDDMNSALLKSPSNASAVSTLGNGMFGKFKGFTLKPLGDAIVSPNSFNASNVAYVQPTPQDSGLIMPQRVAPPPPNKRNDLVAARKVNVAMSPITDSFGNKVPPLPPLNNANLNGRPIISMPVLENSTNIKFAKRNVATLPRLSPTQISQTSVQNIGVHLKPAPPPPIPLHTDSKLNIQRDGTIRRIASLLKKDKLDGKLPVKEKCYIDREKLRTLEISAPITATMNSNCSGTGTGIGTGAVTPLGESSNSDSESTLALKEEETKNLVKRAQSMRSPSNKKNPIQSFGSMRQSNAIVAAAIRPKSVVSSHASLSSMSSRPKSPPPRPPPALTKTNSTTSSGYQMPIGAKRLQTEHTYDDCEFEEQLQQQQQQNNSKVKKDMDNDNIYAVIEDTNQSLECKKIEHETNCSGRNSIASATDISLLNEIVKEIEKRNGGNSVYSTSNLVTTKVTTEEGVQIKTKLQETTSATKIINKDQLHSKNVLKPSGQQLATVPVVNAVASTSYLKSTAINTPIARVAPTRSDLNTASTLSSFKPPIVPTSTLAQAPVQAQAQTQIKPNTVYTHSRLKTKGIDTLNSNKNDNIKTEALNTTSSTRILPNNRKFENATPSSSGGNSVSSAAAAAIASISKPSATIQKPKILSMKPISSNVRNTNSNINSKVNSKRPITSTRILLTTSKSQTQSQIQTQACTKATSSNGSSNVSSTVAAITQRFENTSANANTKPNTVTASASVTAAAKNGTSRINSNDYKLKPKVQTLVNKHT